MRVIYITGCAHTGTTMMLGLMHAFGIPVLPLETPLHVISAYNAYVNERYDTYAAKRIRDTLFSNGVAPDRMASDLRVLEQGDIQIIHMSRDRDAVLASHDGNVSPQRFDVVERQVAEYGNLIDLHLNYEDVLADPAGVQREVASKFNLTITHCWTEYPDFVPEVVHLFTFWPPRRLGAEKGRA